MRRAKVTGYVRTSSGLRLMWVLFLLPRLFIKLFRHALPMLPIIALVALFLLPKTPHLRVSYTYRGSDSHRQYIRCNYLGKQGIVQKVLSGDCPIIAFIGQSSQP